VTSYRVFLHCQHQRRPVHGRCIAAANQSADIPGTLVFVCRVQNAQRFEGALTLVGRLVAVYVVWHRPSVQKGKKEILTVRSGKINAATPFEQGVTDSGCSILTSVNANQPE